MTFSIPVGGTPMLDFIKNFGNDEDGAVTVDFVVLTAAIVVLGLVVGTAISNGSTGLADGIDNSLDDQADRVGTTTVAAIAAAQP
jgi:Flp pilus assembly pilin Flp